MAHDEQSSLERRNFLIGLGTATAGALGASIVGTASAAGATAMASSVTPSVCVFDVNGSLLDVDSMSLFFRRSLAAMASRK